MLNVRIDNLTEDKQLFFFYQHSTHIVVVLDRDFIHYVTQLPTYYASVLIEKSKLLSRERFEKIIAVDRPRYI